jgi:CHAT domain-containing protein/tetratricopeptide (TPR) repeat protein
MMPQRSTLHKPKLIPRRNLLRTFNAAFLILPLAFVSGCQRRISEETVSREAAARFREGDLTKAVEVLEEAKPAGANLRLQLAEAVLSSRDWKRGLEVLRSIPEPQDTLQRARYLTNLAYGLYQKSNRDESAKKVIAQAVELARPLGASETLALALFRQAYIHDFPAESEAWLREGREVGRTLKDPFLEAWSLLDLGYRHYQRQEWDLALPYLLESQRVAERGGARRLENRAIGNAGICYFSLGDLERAEKSFHRALDIAKSCGDDRMVQRWLNDMGLVNLYRGDLEAAESLYEQSGRMALQVGDRREYVRTVLNRGMTALERGDPTHAASILSDVSKEAMDAPQDRRYRAHLARIRGLQGETGPAADLFREVIRDSEQAGDFGILWIARHQFSEFFRARGLNEDARREYLAAIETVQSHWSSLSDDDYRFTLLDGLRVLYSRVVDFYEDQHQPAEALRMAEAGRANLLAKRVGRATSISGAVLPRPPENTVFLSYWLGKQRSALWITSGSDVRHVQLPDEKTIAGLVDRYMSAIREGTDVLEQEHPAGAELFRMLVEPARPLLARNSRVVLSLDRALHNLSFAALPVYGDGGQAHYWLEDVRISVTPSLLLLRNRTDRDFSRDPVLLIGDPLPAPGFAELPHLTTEIKRIAAKTDPERLRLLTRGEATVKRFLESGNQSYALIHFAAHATANHDSPLDSAIILSPEGNRLKLYARDLAQRSLHTPLVCISACTSAGARSYSGEGLVGFVWAFLQAGAESVVAGLWEADDAGTDQLMDEFYAGLFSGMPVDAALQNAQIKLARLPGRFRLPYYWGLFQVYSLRGY